MALRSIPRAHRPFVRYVMGRVWITVLGIYLSVSVPNVMTLTESTIDSLPQHPHPVSHPTTTSIQIAALSPPHLFTSRASGSAAWHVRQIAAVSLSAGS